MKEFENRFSCYKCKRLGVNCAAMHPPNKDCFQPKKITPSPKPKSTPPQDQELSPTQQ